jgi:hypothetical protein
MKFVVRRPDCAYISNWLEVPKRFVNLEGTKRALTFTFADEHSKKMRFVYLWKETEHHLLVPRAFWRTAELPYPVIDCRPRQFPRTGVVSRIKLDYKKMRQPDGSKLLVPTGRDVQRRSVAALMANQGGLLQLACGLGKSIVMLEVIARLQIPALIVVDTSQLILQWQHEIEDTLDVPGGVGLIKADVCDWQHPIVIATYQTLAQRADALDEQIRRWFGLVCWDEAMHVSAPTFVKTADIFYGRRYGLTATPERADGEHILYEFHIGPVLLKDLTQELKPRVVFRWTGLQLDAQVPEQEVTDKTGKLSIPKLGVYYGKWVARVLMILNDVKDAVTLGRKVIVLSNSVDETVNFLAVWTYGYPCPLYTDIPWPEPLDVGETLNPVYLTSAERRKLERKMTAVAQKLESVNTRIKFDLLNPVRSENLKDKRTELEERITEYEEMAKRDRVGRLIKAELRRRQRTYLDDLMNRSTTGGLMIYKVDPEVRDKQLKTRPVTFSITKYGKEALDCQELDTVMVSVPFSDRNMLQQVMGRPSRDDNRKQQPMVVVYEDNIGVVIGMCQRLRQHILDWPVEDNGPYEYELYGHPHARGKRCKTKSTTVFG